MLLGLLIGVVGVCTGGPARIRGRVIEFYGGGVKWLLFRFPDGQFTLAFTLVVAEEEPAGVTSALWSPWRFLDGILGVAGALGRQSGLLAGD
ncbi:MAG: hypothetical protein NTY19_46025 [Planctomycetota bacterium]|nr:hypothetical protein [Planctomycetota bacterium]